MIKERSKRIPVEICCWFDGEDDVSCATVFDLSETGISVVSSDPLPEGRIVTLRVYTPFAAAAIAMKAEVVWSRTEPEGGMGLRFLDMDEKTRGVLRGMVQFLRVHGKDIHKT